MKASHAPAWFTDYFEGNPVALFKYVETGFEDHRPVMTKHIFQLAKMLGLPLDKSKTLELADFPPFVLPESFGNILEIIRMGRKLSYS